jgi:uncharacterized membrane protein
MASKHRILLIGAATLAPLIFTVGAVVWGFRLIDGLLGRYLNPLLPFPMPGLGLLLLIGMVALAGATVSTTSGARLFQALDARMRRVPLAGALFGMSAKIVHSSLASGASTFERCVLVPFPREGALAIAFVTGPAPEAIRKATGDASLVAVFVPSTPNPTSGYTLFVPETSLLDAGLSPEAGFRMVLTAGAFAEDPAGETHWLERLRAS